jgi:type I restriction enzyme M protein
MKQVDKLMDAEAKAKKAAKEAAEALDAAAWKHYAKLTEAEVKELVVNDKWLADLYAALTGEQDRISQRLAGRIAELAERYATPCPNWTARWKPSPRKWKPT